MSTIDITSTPAYCTETEWRNKTGISTTDESSAQFVIDSREAHFLIRRNCMHLVRERNIFKRSDLKCFLPVKWITDGTLSGTITADDIMIYQLSSDGLSFDEVNKSTYLDSIDSFNNYITLTSASSALTRQLYVTYFCLSKYFSEITTDEIKRAVMAQVTVLVLERLRLKWGLRGTVGWSVPGVTVNKDLSSYEKLYIDAKNELEKYVSFLRPFVGRYVRTGMGRNRSYDPSVAYSNQVLAYARTGRTMWW